jgi:uncharacterized protein (TIGR02996 family)
MKEPLPTPEDAFWQQIEARPGEAMPRLLFADWCNENDRPVMAEVQRWLAATGRKPHFWKDNHWFWLSDRSTFEQPVEAIQTMPDELAKQIASNAPGRIPSSNGYIVFGSQRQAEEALVSAWVAATSRGFFRRPWRPDHLPPNGWFMPTKSTTNAEPKQPVTFRSQVISVAIIVAVVLILSELLLWKAEQKYSRPAPVQPAVETTKPQ